MPQGWQWDETLYRGSARFFVVEPERSALVMRIEHRFDEMIEKGALGEGAMGHAGVTGESMIIPNYREWEGHARAYESDAVCSVMVTPLLIGSRLVGAIASVHSDPSREFGQQDLALLNLFAAQASIAIENARLFSSERERASEQEALLDTLADLSGELELSKVLEAVLRRAINLLEVTSGELAI